MKSIDIVAMENTEVSPEYLHWIFYYGAYPLWQYLKQTLDIDITDVCSHVARDEPVLKTDHGKLVVRVVKAPHKEKLPKTFNNDVMFLVNSINTVFSALKEGTERDGEKILVPYKFKLDEYCNMHLVNYSTELPLNDRILSVCMIDE